MTDIEGNGYHSITIGTQTWMRENLKVTKYSNGDPIGTTIPAGKDISLETNPKYQWAYNGDEANAAIYGRLYSWFTLIDSRNICPTGWHVSTYPDWKIMTDWLIANGYNYDGGTIYEFPNKLGKSLSDTTLWNLSNIPGSIGNNDYPEYRNKTDFSALPSGIRLKNGTFIYLGGSSILWETENPFSTEYALATVMNYDNGSIGITNGYDKLDLASSVRCVKY